MDGDGDGAWRSEIFIACPGPPPTAYAPHSHGPGPLDAIIALLARGGQPMCACMLALLPRRAFAVAQRGEARPRLTSALSTASCVLGLLCEAGQTGRRADIGSQARFYCGI